jgi:two-component system sensor histidine kinase DesK
MRIRLLPDIPEIGWTPYLWLVYVGAFFVDPILGRAGAREWAAVALGFAFFLVLYFRGYWKHGIDLLPVVVGQVLLGLVFAPVNAGAAVFFIYAAAAVGFAGPPRVAVRWLLAVVATLALEAWLLRLQPSAWIPGIAVGLIIGAANIFFAEEHRHRRKLQLAQDEVERLAKLAERERIARDLHDLLGHTLSVIALKAELAGRLLERDPAAAAAEIDEVQRVSREALAEVRRAVEGYRERGFAVELDGVRQALRAAGVALEERVEIERLPPAVESVLALALREAVTNVIRHAAATRCRVALVRTAGDPPEVTLEVRDDGHGGGLAPEGVGLSGMRERAEACGGRLERFADGGTVVRLTLPLAAAVAAAGPSPRATNEVSAAAASRPAAAPAACATPLRDVEAVS